METIRVDLKTSKHFWFNYSFVHCVQWSMYTKNGAFSKFLILYEKATHCGLSRSILDPFCSAHWDKRFQEQNLVVWGDCDCQLRVELAVVGMCGRDDGSNREGCERSVMKWN